MVKAWVNSRWYANIYHLQLNGDSPQRTFVPRLAEGEKNLKARTTNKGI
jgi:hypothetical protein